MALSMKKHRLSRRTLLRHAAVLGGLAASGTPLVSRVPAAAAATPTARALLFPLISNPTPNPVTLPGGLSSILLNKNLFSQLVRPDPQTDQPVPDLAKSWTISKDGLTYTFLLRDALFHDGRPVTAGDVKFTLDAIMDKTVHGTFRANLGPLKETKALNDHTVQITMSEPYGPLLTMLQYNIMVLPEHALKGQDIRKPTAFVEHPIGSGPYMWKEFVQGDHLTLTKFDKFWAGAPKIPEVVYEIIPDVNTQIAKLKAGELDFVMVEPSQIASIAAAGVQMSYANQTNYYYLGTNTQHPLFKDPRVRRAMAMALEKEQIVKTVLQGHGRLIASPVSPPMRWAFDTALTPLPYDLRQAKSLLTEAGAKMENGVLTLDGRPYRFKILVDIGNPTRKQLGLIAQQQWGALGMQPQMDFQEFNNWYDMIGNLKYETAVEWWITPADPNALRGGYDSRHDGTDAQHPNFADPVTDGLFDQGVRLSTPEERRPVYDKLQARLKEMQPDIFLNFPNEVRAFSGRVHGFGSVGIRDALYWTYTWTLS
jgi:peptide/nickel transport system substrate-binding protein